MHTQIRGPNLDTTQQPVHGFLILGYAAHQSGCTRPNHDQIISDRYFHSTTNQNFGRQHIDIQDYPTPKIRHNSSDSSTSRLCSPKTIPNPPATISQDRTSRSINLHRFKSGKLRQTNINTYRSFPTHFPSFPPTLLSCFSS